MEGKDLVKKEFGRNKRWFIHWFHGGRTELGRLKKDLLAAGFRFVEMRSPGYTLPPQWQLKVKKIEKPDDFYPKELILLAEKHSCEYGGWGTPT